MSETAAYRVLARKYRPQVFSDLIGQDTLVRTLSNAFALNRIAHAYILTGIRGIGKTTSARIIAKALNCVGADGKGGITLSPCGVCTHCASIAESRHVDVLEIDAASHTSVENIRELIENSRYAPALARFKVYIIDEVHMLSRSAFNALLKTLEEPPPTVKFIFATTEIHKVPVTVLSRCQRFDLRRVEEDELVKLFGKILEKENAQVEPEALRLIAMAADGSVRDGLSLLDQALALSDQKITAGIVREMIGLADRTYVFTLLEHLFKGDVRTALAQAASLYHEGAEPTSLLTDMLETVHTLTKIKLMPQWIETTLAPEAERTKGKILAEGLSIPTLSLFWQMLLKGLSELSSAPAPLPALEMILVRLAHVAACPPPAVLIRQLADGGETPVLPPAPASSPGASPPVSEPSLFAATNLAPQVHPSPVPVPSAEDKAPKISSFYDIVALAARKGEAVLSLQLKTMVRPVSCKPGHLEVSLESNAPRSLVGDLTAKLAEWTGTRWIISVVADRQGGETLSSQAAKKKAALSSDLGEHPLVKATLEAFPGASISSINIDRKKESADPDDELEILELTQDED